MESKRFTEPIHFFTCILFPEYSAYSKKFKFFTKDCISMSVTSNAESTYFSGHNDVMKICYGNDHDIHFRVTGQHRTYVQPIPWIFTSHKDLFENGYCGDTFSSAITILKEMLEKYDIFFIKTLSLFLHKDIIIIIHRFFLSILIPKQMTYGYMPN